MWDLLGNAGLMAFWDPMTKGMNNFFGGINNQLIAGPFSDIHQWFTGKPSKGTYAPWNTQNIGLKVNPADTATPSMQSQKQMIRNYQATHPTPKNTSHPATKPKVTTISGIPSNLVLYGVGALVLLIVLEK